MVHANDARSFGRILVVALLASLKLPVLAQEQATSFDQLRVLVAPGQKVNLTSTAGKRLAGTIAGLTSSTLSLKVGKELLELREADVQTIRHRGNDSLRNGALWGLGTGAGVGMVTCGRCHVGPGLVAAAMFGGIGSGIGVGIDALIRTEMTVFQRRGAAGGKVTVVPQLAKSHQGVMVSVRF
jgi:hypothetical protein